MKCKYCGRTVPENSIFCNWCGEKLLKARKKKDDVSVPEPRQLPSGMWNIQLRAEGQSVTEKTAELCTTKARAIRAGYIKQQKAMPKMTVGKMIDEYIESNSNVLSPSTIKNYKAIRRNHLQDIINKDIKANINWQKVMNDEAKHVSPKTVANVWRLVTASMRSIDMPIPNINLPQIPVNDMPWLDYEQIKIFLKAIEGEPCELGALLALHSLRRSELLNLTPQSIDKQKRIIHVKGARVKGENGLVSKGTNKNKSSTRDVPIMVDRLLELIPDAGEDYIITQSGELLKNQINRICRKNNLPEVGLHGLRRSFASLAYHLGWNERTTMEVGGWSDSGTVHKFYIKLAGQDVNENIEKMKEFFNDDK